MYLFNKWLASLKLPAQVKSTALGLTHWVVMSTWGK